MLKTLTKPLSLVDTSLVSVSLLERERGGEHSIGVYCTLMIVVVVVLAQQTQLQ